MIPTVAIYECICKFSGSWIGDFLNVKMRFYFLDHMMQNEVKPQIRGIKFTISIMLGDKLQCMKGHDPVLS